MVATKLLYLENFNLLDADASVLDILEENGRTVVVLDQTVFYPQGGGQPYDQGVIESPDGKFLVEEVRFVDGTVKHIGKFELGGFTKGDAVRCTVDGARRMLNSRLHSAGHVVDMAVVKLGLKWIPGKGYHFSDGPYVEYAGSLEEMDKEKLKADIERACNEFISEGKKTELRFMPKEQMSSVCHFVPDYIPEGKPARVVMYGDPSTGSGQVFGIPCGGTHVSNLSEIKPMTIRKIRAEGKNVRIGYDVTR